MKFYRVIDHDFAPPYIVIRDFIDFNDVGIVVENEGEYIGDLADSDFDKSKVKIGYEKRDMNIFTDDSYLDEFKHLLEIWWNEPMHAKKIKLDKLDHITLDAMKQFKGRLFGSIFRGN